MNLKKLLQILQTQTATYHQFRMFSRIIREVRSIPGCGYYVHQGNIYVTKGKAGGFPCVVAHMDTVHDLVEDLVAVQVGRNITGINPRTMQQSGIGGDDKVGVFIALDCLHQFDELKAAFFRDEETGCEGSYEAHLDFFEDCHFVLQCDRQGYGDFIVEAGGVELSSLAFQRAVDPFLQAYNYTPGKGMMTDVMALKEIGIACSVANMSCGYFNPHTDQEFVNLDGVEHCLELVKSIIREIGDVPFPHTIDYPPVWSKSSFHHAPIILDYCLDCWAAPATATGYCRTCNDYYHQLMR